METTDPRFVIREYEPAHRPQLRRCFVELQNFERSLEPTLPEGEQIADTYLEFLFEQCARWQGRLFVADVEGAVAGFVGVLTRLPADAPDDEQAEYAYISDLVVLPSCRRRGIGRALLEHAEAFARASGTKTLRLGVLATNVAARHLYDVMGYREYQVQLTKRLQT